MAEGASGYQDTDIAIVGLACRFAGANNPHEYWRNLREGVECIRPLSSAELEVAGVDPVLLHHPRYVRVAAPIDDIAGFDADFFGLSAREAQVMDPQNRHFLEVWWDGLESSL